MLWELSSRTPTMPNIGPRFAGPIDHLGDVLEIDRHSLKDPDDQVVEFLRVSNPCRGPQLDLHVLAGDLVSRRYVVGRANRPLHIDKRELISLQSIRRNFYLSNSGLTADEVGAVDVADRREAFDELFSDAAQLKAVVAGPLEGQRHYRHIVDLNGLENPIADRRRNHVLILVELLKEFDQASFAVLAYIKSDGDDRLVVARHAVDIFDTVDLREHPLQGRRYELLDLVGVVTRSVDEDIGKRDDDLRILLAGCQPKSRKTDQGGGDDQDDRKVAVDKRADDPREEIVRAVVVLRGTCHYRPSASSLLSRIVSPDCKPAKT